MDEIIALLSAHDKAMDVFDIAGALDKPVDDVYEALLALIRAGAVVLTKKGKYALSADVGLVPARTVVLKSGAPVARPLAGGPDLRIRERGAMRPMADDIILIRPEAYEGDGMGRCQLVAITERLHARFEAVLTMTEVREEPRKPPQRKGRRRGAKETRVSYVPTVRPIDPRLPPNIELEGELMGARSGDMVLLRVTRWPERGVKLRAAIERVMGEANDIRVQLKSIVLSHGLSDTFPPDVTAQADAVPTAVSEAELAGRLDLRPLTLFTIDGDDAQDFDDAVSLEAVPGGWELGVHIADVAHYVRRKTPIDREALARGTSVYLPGLTLPMLPEALSNRMCSLMPDVDRLAMSLMMTVEDGVVTRHVLAPSVIHSRARLTYDQVNRMLNDEENNIPPALNDTLRDMVRLAQALRDKRHARGSIDFDMPEAEFTLDTDGRPTDVRARSRGEAERLIEDFMLLANETVARHARAAKLPMIYRVHAKPDADRVRLLEVFLASLGVKARLGVKPSPAKYQKILKSTAGLSEAGLIQQVMLKSLRRAEYSASPDGHFGLAARDYCHFTSPIRRYPDLQVHRMLKLMLEGDEKVYGQYEKRMPELASQCSACEQKAARAERDADDLLKAHYMLGHIGETFEGVVTGVTAWGFYVTLHNTVEGLVPLRTLRGDYVLDEARHTLRSTAERSIRLGDTMRIRVERVNTALAQIDFALLD